MTRLKRKKELPSHHENDVRFGTPRDVAMYRAKRLAEFNPTTIVEVGAGAGFQTQEFAKVANVIAIDIDVERLARAKMPSNVISIPGDALAKDIIAQVKAHAKGKVVIFLDPERPATSKQRTLSEIKPDIHKFIEVYGEISDAIAIELPPFLQEVPQGEREYLSIEGKLNRLTLYTGALRKCDVSVVQLPSGARVEHNGELPALQPSAVEHKWIIEPDVALAHAGLVPLVLPAGYETLRLGKKIVYLTDAPVESPFLRSFQIIASGKDVEKSLAKCATLILHGSMEPEEQRVLLRKLNKLCTGKRRMHLFVGTRQFLTATQE